MAKWMLILFVAVVLVNAYFRFRVIKAYNILQKRGLNFKAKDMLDSNKLENDIIPNNKEYEKQIRDYVRFLKVGFGMTSILLIIVLGFAFIPNRASLEYE